MEESGWPWLAATLEDVCTIRPAGAALWLGAIGVLLAFGTSAAGAADGLLARGVLLAKFVVTAASTEMVSCGKREPVVVTSGAVIASGLGTASFELVVARVFGWVGESCVAGVSSRETKAAAAGGTWGLGVAANWGLLKAMSFCAPELFAVAEGAAGEDKTLEFTLLGGASSDEAMFCSAMLGRATFGGATAGSVTAAKTRGAERL